MQIVVQPNGQVRCVYSEDVDLHQLGRLSIVRGSRVEPTADGRWTADISPVNGPMLGPFDNRSAALAGELDWLLCYWLAPAQ